jgi:hypothetical protein
VAPPIALQGHTHRDTVHSAIWSPLADLDQTPNIMPLSCERSESAAAACSALPNAAIVPLKITLNLLPYCVLALPPRPSSSTYIGRLGLSLITAAFQMFRRSSQVPIRGEDVRSVQALLKSDQLFSCL